jgi:hypothetical protein
MQQESSLDAFESGIRRPTQPFCLRHRPGTAARRTLLDDCRLDVGNLLKAMGAWMEANASRAQGTQFFIDGGGFGTVETDPAELSRMIATHPFTQYSDVEVKPLIDPISAMAVLVEAYS